MVTWNPANQWCLLCTYCVPGPVLYALGILSYSSLTVGSGVIVITILTLETVTQTGQGSHQAHG